MNTGLIVFYVIAGYFLGSILTALVYSNFYSTKEYDTWYHRTHLSDKYILSIIFWPGVLVWTLVLGPYIISNKTSPGWLTKRIQEAIMNQKKVREQQIYIDSLEQKFKDMEHG